MHAEDCLLVAQVRLQVIMSVNIYEAIIHGVLFARHADSDAVHNLRFINSPIEISIPDSKLSKSRDAFIYDRKEIKTCFIGSRKKDISKLRFDSKEIGRAHV